MTELRWDGKYDADGKKVLPIRLALPFQTVETVNESAVARQVTGSLFDAGEPTEWRNRLIWGDKKYVLPALLPEFAGKVDLIYIDPPFNTGSDFSFTAEVPSDGEGDDASFEKQASAIERRAYHDTWGNPDSFFQWIYETIVIMRDLLSERGCLYLHLDRDKASYARIILDEVFGPKSYINDISWKRINAKGNVTRKWGVVQESILFYAKDPVSFTWNQVFRPLGDKYVAEMYRFVDEDTGRRYRTGDLTAPASRASKGQQYDWKGYKLGPTRVWVYNQDKMQDLEDQGRIIYSKSGYPQFKRYLDEGDGERIPDWWEDITVASGKEMVGYPTQKPEALLERIISASSNPGDLVLDSFSGSGTTAAVAEKLGRRWIVADLGRFAIHTTRKRLLAIPDVKPFVVQNLGRYERQAWQEHTFGQSADARQAAYRNFILRLYGATAVPGYLWIHGLKNGRAVHVGGVEAPVTPSDIANIAAEFRRMAGTGANAPKEAGVDVLGWDFALDLNETAEQQALKAGLDLRLKIIPREVLEKRAREDPDVTFYEAAALGFEATTKGREATVELTDFIMPPDGVPKDILDAITHWAQWIDYWAVDWNFDGRTFHNMAQTYRTKKEPTLRRSLTHLYEVPGEYTVVVKVVDQLGNDTTRTTTLRVL